MPQWIRQAAAIPVYNGQICLVTSSSGRRWVIPKGVIEPGQTAGETALQEVWEEAGLTGVLHSEPVGTYLYEKYGGLCHVMVYLMNVADESEEWPERLSRQRVWLPIEEAAERIREPGLREILESIFRSGRTAENASFVEVLA
ncbi:MAG: NUDIX hydrolase [Planctomycetes bacterium]|nr:NUDIX hydrolase [Planctomycetota bacterium]